ncbi:MAG: DUF4340 domain-containing protein [Bacteroidota bacterium]
MKRSTLVLLVVLAVLLVAAYFVMQRPGELSSTGPEHALVEFDSAAVDRVEIRGSNGTVTLEKLGGVWMLTDPIRYKADEAAISGLLGSGRKIMLSSLVSTNPEKQHLFDVDSTSGTLVRVFDRGAEKAAFRIGKMGPTYLESYVRKEGSNEVYLGTGFYSSTFARRPNEWRDKTIFKAEQSAIKDVKFQYGDTLFTLTFRDSTWMVGNEQANQQNVNAFLNALANLQADEFVDSAVAPMPKPVVQIEVLGTQIRYYAKKEGDRYYVQTSGVSQLYEVYSWRAQQILKRKKDFLGQGS